MSYQLKYNSLVHHITFDQLTMDAALPDGHVRGVRLVCNPLGNRLEVPIDDLSIRAVVTCLECIATKKSGGE